MRKEKQVEIGQNLIMKVDTPNIHLGDQDRLDWICPAPGPGHSHGDPIHTSIMSAEFVVEL